MDSKRRTSVRFLFAGFQLTGLMRYECDASNGPLYSNRKHIMQVLFIDGIGGTKLYRRKLLSRLNQAGHEVTYFSYLTAFSSFAEIYTKLADRIRHMANRGEYALIGYSFGGVLARAALQHALANVKSPAHLVLLASPVRSPKLSKQFGGCVAYRLLTGDCGQVAASPRRMRAIAIPAVPTSCLVGTKTIAGLSRYVGQTVNDGMVSTSETCPQRFRDAVYLPVSHPFLPDNLEAISIIVDRLAHCSTSVLAIKR